MNGTEAPAHTPVLVQEVLDALSPKDGSRYIDGTVGAGGHTARILEASGPNGRLLGLDRDIDALGVARRDLAGYGSRLILVESNFDQMESVALAHNFVPAQGILIDMGLSSMQLTDSGRGFSFVSDNLDMRMSRSQGPTAGELVNGLEENKLADIIYRFGEEPLSKRIARSIVDARPVSSGRELAAVIERAVRRHGRVHPATKTFQALRIAVNDEMGNIERLLPQLSRVTTLGSKVAIITFHSLEDRPVKIFFKNNPEWRNLTKHPIRPSRSEIVANPRSRSAKLRVAERLQP